MKIEKITNPFAWELYQSRRDEAIVTGQPLIERPFWYRNTETGQCFLDIMGCIGWPNVITDKQAKKPGYAAIIGIIKNAGSPETAPFQLLDETESQNIQTLFKEMVKMRNDYGFGLHPNLLQVWFGNTGDERFNTELALYNVGLMKNGGEKQAILIVPPDDIYDSNVSDIYIRAIRQSVAKNSQRLYYGGNDILKNRVGDFLDKDPVIMAVGGLVHSLLSRCMWLDQTRENAFNIEEEANG
jgi:hypothetical protein